MPLLQDGGILYVRVRGRKGRHGRYGKEEATTAIARYTEMKEPSRKLKYKPRARMRKILMPTKGKKEAVQAIWRP